MIGYTGFSEEEQYYFDLRGSLVVRGVLGDAVIGYPGTVKAV